MKPRPLQELHSLFTHVRNQHEAEILLQDILTPRELKSVVERWQLIQMLAAGASQRDIKKKLHISISKITRGSHMLKHGSGGFLMMLKRLGKKIV